MGNSTELLIGLKEAFIVITAPLLLLLFGVILSLVFGLKPTLDSIKRDTAELPKLNEKMTRLGMHLECIPSVNERTIAVEALLRGLIAKGDGKISGPIAPLDPVVELPKTKIKVNITIKERAVQNTIVEFLFTDNIPREAIQKALNENNWNADFSSNYIVIQWSSDDPGIIANSVSMLMASLDDNLVTHSNWEKIFEEKLKESMRN